jgi:hypothetical protein
MAHLFLQNRQPNIPLLSAGMFMTAYLLHMLGNGCTLQLQWHGYSLTITICIVSVKKLKLYAEIRSLILYSVIYVTACYYSQ